MATTEQLQQLVGKLMLDPAFRREFAGDPEVSAQRLNIQLTPEEVASFRINMEAFIDAAAELEKGAAATGLGGTQAAAAGGGHIAAIFRE